MRPDKAKKPFRGLRALRLCALAAALLCGAGLAAYGISYLRAGRTRGELREMYYASPSPQVSPSAAPALPSGTREGARVRDYDPVTPPPEGVKEAKEGARERTAEPTVPPATAVPRVTARPVGKHLEAEGWPGNPNGAVSPRFAALREENPDIIGWLSAGGIIDTAVVQRDNEYYLTHDALGKANRNGAVFLEETVDLKACPWTLVLYGHNMKSGEMFGCLRRYEDLSFYRAEPFIRMDTLYGDGLYVIAAAAVISGEDGDRAAVDLSRLCSMTAAWRREEIEKLMSLSVYTQTVDVEPGDRLLLLVTCFGEGDGRRVVLARSVRDGETEGSLAALAALAERK